MKRKNVLIFIAICCLACTLVCLCACNKPNDQQDKDNISRLTQSYYAGESEDFAVSIETGMREKCFIADGKATDVVEFAEIVITPLKQNDCEKLAYQIKGQDATLSGEVTSSNYGEFIGELKLDFVPTSVTLTVGEEECEIELCNILEGALNANDIINIAKNEFAERIASEGETLNREIYVKLISGDRIGYYYYVSFIGEGVDYWAMLVDIKTGEIVSQK